MFPIMFADASNLFINHKDINSIIDQINYELFLVLKWGRANKLSVNIDKTKFMIFSRNRCTIKHIPLKIDNILIDQVEQTKFLGAILDNKLKWKKHINYIANKISNGIGIFKKNTTFVK